jgi:hypothetical protein
MGKRPLRIVKLTWILANTLIFVWWLALERNTEGQMMVIYAINALSFPIGIACYVLLTMLVVLLERLSINIENNCVVDIVLWLPIVLCGYFQWFKFLPWLVARLRNLLGTK